MCRISPPEHGYLVIPHKSYKQCMLRASDSLVTVKRMISEFPVGPTLIGKK